MTVTDKTDNHEGAQLSQKAFLLVSLLEQQVRKSDIPSDLYQRMAAQITELNGVLGDLSSHLKALAGPASTLVEPVSPQPTSLLIMDSLRFTLSSPQQSVKLTKLEFKFHQLMATHPRQVFSRSHLMDSSYTDYADICERTIDCHIRKLRAKHRQLYPKLRFIHTMYGVGYYYAEPEHQTEAK
ncbi:DNA-binding response OmpR family regulator [Rheinheimera pacifica]|uniref:winged helix-turn-helix domain-containing protein n=1 Tax=Rheinheimera pacifica TaxID=173990 RepID=UPI00285F74A5|nr:winged helix-turn-helix domain-containing protein [Rheinheimera pacifica]MDR6985387.1 DNA-binding response OmpR family regulator [Rheinheimera pacifica]